MAKKPPSKGKKPKRQKKEPAGIEINVRKGEEAEKRIAAVRAEAEGADAKLVADIRHDVSKTARKGAGRTLEGKVSRSKGKVHRIAVGSGAVVLGLMSGTALAWFVATQLLTTATPVLAAVPSSATVALLSDGSVPGSDVRLRMPEGVSLAIKDAADPFGIDQNLVDAAVGSYGAVGFAETGEGQAFFAALRRTDGLDAALGPVLFAHGLPETANDATIESETGNAMHLTRTEAWLFASTDAGLMEELLALEAGTGTSLAADEAARSALKQVSGGPLSVFWRPSRALPGTEALPALLDPTGGFSESDVLAASFSPREDGIRFDVFMSGDAPARSGGGDLLAFLPASATMAVQGGDLEQSWRSLEEAAENGSDVEGGGLLALANAQASVEALTGLRLQDDLLKQFDGSMLVFSARTDGDPNDDAFAIVAETGRTDVDAFLASFEESAVKQYAERHPVEREFILDDGSAGKELVPDVQAFDVADAKEGGILLRVIHEPEGRGGVTHARLGNAVIVSSSEALARDILKTAQGEQEGLRETALPRLGTQKAGQDLFYMDLADRLNGIFGAVILTEEPVRDGALLHGVLTLP